VSCLNAEQTDRIRELSKRCGRDSNDLSDVEFEEYCELVGLISVDQRATDGTS
jgi:hypothetical protein